MQAVEIGVWEGRGALEWRRAWGVPDVCLYASVGSTNDVARALAQAGAPAGTVAIAEEQRAGRGREGRPWLAPLRSSILLSIVLRAPSGNEAGVLPLRVGLAAARGVESAAGVRVGIKWPNDLMVSGSKVGGILCEGSLGRHAAPVIAGIGINVTQVAEDFDGSVRAGAVSLYMATGRLISRGALAGAIVRRVVAASGRSGLLETDELEELGRRDVLRDNEVSVNGRRAGQAAGIAPDGALLVKRGPELTEVRHGTVRTISSAEGQKWL